MFTDAGAHFMQYRQHAIGYSLVRVLQTVETDELTHISVITSVGLCDWRFLKKTLKLRSAFPVSR